MEAMTSVSHGVATRHRPLTATGFTPKVRAVTAQEPPPSLVPAPRRTCRLVLLFLAGSALLAVAALLSGCDGPGPEAPGVWDGPDLLLYRSCPAPCSDAVLSELRLHAPTLTSDGSTATYTRTP